MQARRRRLFVGGGAVLVCGLVVDDRREVSLQWAAGFLGGSCMQHRNCIVGAAF